MNFEALVSVATIFLNEEKFLEEAIESILAQTHDCWELFLVDDGSTDGSTGIARRFAERLPERVKYLEHPGHANRGMSASRNLAIRCARGEYVSFLDGDDVWLPAKLQEQVAIMRAEPTAAMVYGRTLIWHSWTGRATDESRDRFYTLGVQPDRLIRPPRLLIQLIENRAQTPTTCNVLIRRSVFEQIGLFEDSFPGVHEDQVFYTKVHLTMPSFVANACWAKYRQHPESSSAVASQKGLRAAARLKYLQWAGEYFAATGVKDPEIWRALDAEFRRYRDRRRQAIRQKIRSVAASGQKGLRELSRRVLPAPVRRGLMTAADLSGVRAPRALILVYHGIGLSPSHPFPFVSPAHFEEHLEVVRTLARPLPLSRLADGLSSGRWPRRSLVLTLDDASLDELEIARPLLERKDVPATIFVTTGGLGCEHEFWWDELARLLLRPEPLPPSLTLVVNDTIRSFEETDGSDHPAAGWHSTVAPSAASLVRRRIVFEALQRLMLPLDSSERSRVLGQLRGWASVNDSASSDRRPLSVDDLSAAASTRLIEIGAQTVNHPLLPLLPISDQYREIHESRARLEQLLGRATTSFAYPRGAHSADTLIAVEEAGFLRACTISRAPVLRRSQRFRLPRIEVQDWDGEQFARELDSWFRIA